MTRDQEKSTMPSTLKARLSAILRGWVTPLLEARGFRKKANRFVSGSGNVAWLIDVQQSKWNDSEHVQFTMNCGVYIAGVASTFLNRPEPVQIQLTDCCVYVRAGMLAADRLDKWWELRKDDSTDAGDCVIGEELSMRLRNDILPFLDRFPTRERVLEFLEAPRAQEDTFVWPQNDAIAFCYAATIASLIDQPDKVSMDLQKAIDAARGHAIEEVVFRVADQLRKKSL